MTVGPLRVVDAGTDLAAWVEVHNRVSPTAVSVEEVRAYREALEDATHLLALRDDRPVGAAAAELEPGQRLRGTTLAWIGVPVEARGQGVGSALLHEVSSWAGAAGLEALEGHVLADDDGSLAWAARRGFAEIGRELRLALELRDLRPPDVTPPAGVEVATLASRPDLAPAVYEVAREAYPDIPGEEESEMEPYEDWLAHDMSGPNDDPEGVFLAVAGGEVIGYSKFHLPQARLGVAVHDLTGVKRAWRGRGVAGALKRAQIAWAKERGYERLETWNEERNAPIRKLNERLGYRPASGQVLLRGPLFHSGGNVLQSD
ncbi:MAG: GNAT family N-acetyltransferase [Gaiellaceae bacterium]